MLRAVEDLDRMRLAATDGEIGSVEDVYFDDQDWTVRYLVVETGGWLMGRRVLVAPHAIIELHWDDREIEVALTQNQVRESPPVETQLPVSRQYETDLSDFYGYPYYWSGPFLWGSTSVPRAMKDAAIVEASERRMKRRQNYDPRLRSADEVTSYGITARDGAIGHIEDFLYDDETWSLRYLVVDTRNWLPGQHVLVAVEWIDRVDWSDSTVHVELTRDAIRESPKYNRDILLLPEDEAQIYMHYGKRSERKWAHGPHSDML